MIPLLKHQAEFISSSAIHSAIVGGFGSGKSRAGTIKTVLKKRLHPEVKVAYYLPSYPLIRDIAFPNFTEILEELGIGFKLHETNKVFETEFGDIILRSMDNPKLIVGYETGYSLIDEADTVSNLKMKALFRQIVARNRKPLNDGTPNCLDFVSTPEGFNFMYDFFVVNDSPIKYLVRAKTKDNPFVKDDYISTLSETYTEQEIKAYLEGEFLNLTSGTVYHAFDRKINHSDREIKPTDSVLHIGMDFNITNMSATVRLTDGDLSTAVDEFTKVFDTADMIQAIKSRYQDKKIVVYPDASGNARNTAGDSDILLLKKSGFKVMVGRSNPSVRDRITTANGSFRNANGITTSFVNTKNCPDLTEAYERLAYKKGVPDKESGYDHVTDADTYCIFGLKKGINKIKGSGVY